jgi:hypothetical protein
MTRIADDFKEINRRLNGLTPRCEYCHCPMTDCGNTLACGRSECNAFGRHVLKLRLIDNDRDEITVTLANKQLRGWSYASDDERRIKVLMAREYVEGLGDGWKYYGNQETALYLRDLHNRQDVRKMLVDFAGMPNTAEVRQLIVDRLNRTKGSK